MLFIVEILFFVMGIYALIAARLPAWFVGKGYIAEGSTVRVLGLIMAAPLPVGFCAGIVVGIIDPELISSIGFIEGLSIVAVSVIAVFTLRKIRKPETPPEIKS